MALTVENINYNESPEAMKGPESKVGFQMEKELSEALQAIRAHEDAKKTVESTKLLAEKETQEAGIPLSPKERGNLELSDTVEPLSKSGLMNKLEGKMFNIISEDEQMQKELKYVFTPENRIQQANQNPESARQVQVETGTVAYA